MFLSPHFESSLYIVELYQMSFAKILSQSMDYLFILLTASFKKIQKFLILMKWHSLIFLLWGLLFGVIAISFLFKNSSILQKSSKYYNFLFFSPPQKAPGHC